MQRTSSLGGWSLAAGAFAILSVAVALFSFRYLAPAWPAAPEMVAKNAFAHPWLPIHATMAAVALLVMPFQFWTRPDGKRTAWHKIAGRTYVVVCLLAAPAGLILAFGATTGPVSTAGFGTLAVVWFAVNALGWKAAVDGRFADHRRWMIRSFALTFGAVTLRLYLPIAPLLGFSFEDGYRAISFLSWVPNLIIAEVLLRTWLRTPLVRRARPAPAMA
jgi:uncharacterized membrane protein